MSEPEYLSALASLMRSFVETIVPPFGPDSHAEPTAGPGQGQEHDLDSRWRRFLGGARERVSKTCSAGATSGAWPWLQWVSGRPGNAQQAKPAGDGHPRIPRQGKSSMQAERGSAAARRKASAFRAAEAARR